MQCGQTVFHVAAVWNRKTILDRLLMVRRQHCCSTSACPRISWQSIADITDNDGKTPLFLAAYHGHVDCVDVLLFHGANPDHRG